MDLPLGVRRLVIVFHIDFFRGTPHRHDGSAKLVHSEGSQSGEEVQLLAGSHVDCPAVDEVDDTFQV